MKWGWTKSLAFIVTVYTALVIAGGTAVYAIYEYVQSPDTSALSLLIEGGWQIAGYALLVYLTISLVLYRKVVRPVRRLNVKLYAISRGDLTPVSVKTDVKEVREIARVVNYLLDQLGKSVPGIPLSELSVSGEKLREMAHELAALDQTVKESLLGIANRVEQVVETLSKESLQKRAEETTADLKAARAAEGLD